MELPPAPPLHLSTILFTSAPALHPVRLALLRPILTMTTNHIHRRSVSVVCDDLPSLQGIFSSQTDLVCDDQKKWSQTKSVCDHFRCSQTQTVCVCGLWLTALGHLSITTGQFDTKFEETIADESFNSLVKYGSHQQFNRYHNLPTTVVYGLVRSASKWWWLSNPYNFANIC